MVGGIKADGRRKGNCGLRDQKMHTHKKLYRRHGAINMHVFEYYVKHLAQMH